MKKWKGKSKGNATGYKIFIYIINTLGLGFAYFILIFVAFYFYLFSIKEKKHIGWYFKNIHNSSYINTQISIYKSFYNIGVSILDKIAFLSSNKSLFTFNHEGEDHLHKLASLNNGGIIIGAHIGNWEIAGQLMERIDVRVNIVMKLNEDEAISKVIEDSLSLKKMNIINISDDFSYLINIKKALDNNEFVILHGDRFVDESNIMKMDFMGKKANFPKGPFLLALKFRKPIIFAFAMKESKNHYHFYASKPINNTKRVNPTNLDEETKILIEKYILNLESIVYKYPTQWFNFYKFWE